MKPNYFYIFKNKVLLEAAEEAPQDPKISAEDDSSDLDRVLNNSKKVNYTLVKLLTTYEEPNDKTKEELKNLITDIRCISYKPTTFRIILANGNFFDLKYDPTPSQLKYPSDYKPSDLFVANILGKHYNLSNKSEYEQCLDYIQKIQRENPILVKEPGEGETGGPAGKVETPPEDTSTDQTSPDEEK